MIKQELEVDFAKHLGKFEKVIKDNDMLLMEVKGVEATMICTESAEEEPDDFMRLGSLGLPTGRYIEITARVLVPLSSAYSLGRYSPTKTSRDPDNSIDMTFPQGKPFPGM